MQFSTFAIAVSLLRLAVAQTPKGFVPVVNQTLSVTYGNNTISPAGELIPRPEVASPPTIVSSVFSPTGLAVIFLIDLDVPRNGMRVPLLHWFQPGVTSTGANSSLTIPLAAPGGAPYLQPSPPVGDSPHRYTFLLFDQPANFTIPPGTPDFTNTTNRVGFNYTAFFAQTGLSTPIAANYILVQNTTGTSMMSYPPSSFTTTATVGGDGSTMTIAATGTVVTGGSTMTTTSGGETSAVSTETANAAAVVVGGSGMSFVMALFWLFG